MGGIAEPDAAFAISGRERAAAEAPNICARVRREILFDIKLLGKYRISVDPRLTQ